MNPVQKIYAKSDSTLALTVIPGHFSSDRFHLNYYIDMTPLKTHQNKAEAVAKAMIKSYVNRIEIHSAGGLYDQFEQMSKIYANKTHIDTIICMDGCEVIGAYVAKELSNLGYCSADDDEVTYIISPEFDASGQMVVRDNIREMIRAKHVLIVLASAMSGRTISKSLQCIKAYGGIVEGLSVIFSLVDNVQGYTVNSVFASEDLPDFKLSEPDHCPMCENAVALDAIVNSYGYTEL